MARRLLAILFGLLLGLLLVEGGARLYVRFRLSPDERAKLVLPYATLPYLPHPYINWVNRPNCLARDGEMHNSQGFRGIERPIAKGKGVYRIACLGGSTTYTQRVKEAETYPAQLETYLRGKLPNREIEVLNAGVKGYTSAESLLGLLFTVLDYSPDAIVLYHAVNDAYPRGYPNFRPDYLHCRVVWVGEDVEKNGLLTALESTSFFPLARSRTTDYGKRGALYYWIYDPAITQTSLAASLRDGTTEGLELNLAATCRVARARGIACVVASQAQNLVSDYAPPSSESIDQMNAASKKVAAAEGAIFLDVGKDFPQAEGYFDRNDQVHMQGKGARELARRIGDGMFAMNVFQKTAPRPGIDREEPSALRELPRLESPLSAKGRARIENGEIVRPSPYFCYGLVPGAAAGEGLGPHDVYGRRSGSPPAAAADRERRIVVLGGSSAYGVGVTAEESMPAQLQQRLRERGMNNVVVMNCGVPGYTTAETLAAAHFRDLRTQAFVVVIANDFEDALPRVRPGYRTDYSHARKTFRFGDASFPTSLVATPLASGDDLLGSGAPLRALRDGNPGALAARDGQLARPGPYAMYRNLRSLVDLARNTPNVEKVVILSAGTPAKDGPLATAAADWNAVGKRVAEETKATFAVGGESLAPDEFLAGSFLPNAKGQARRAAAVAQAVFR